jgi:DUF971 family protein
MNPPREVRLDRAARCLNIDWGEGHAWSLPAEYLRVESPSAEVRGHSLADRKLVTGRRAVGIASLEPVGNYAIRLIFDDGHDTGIYSWDFLDELGLSYDQRWARYLAALTQAKASRDPPPR